MTLVIEPTSLPDKLLAVFGKRRAVFVPDGIQAFGYYIARRESILRALLRPKSMQPPAGWVYWEDIPMTEATDSDSLPTRIGDFFVSAKDAVLSNLEEDERGLLRAIGFADALALRCEKTTVALFGGESVVPDYVPPDGSSIVECKYVRKGKGHRFNEYDIKNALGQILEQATCKSTMHAILVLLDAGRASDRDWNDVELNFVKMFKDNPFGIRLTLVRVRIEEEKKSVTSKCI